MRKRSQLLYQQTKEREPIMVVLCLLLRQVVLYIPMFHLSLYTEATTMEWPNLKYTYTATWWLFFKSSLSFMKPISWSSFLRKYFEKFYDYNKILYSEVWYNFHNFFNTFEFWHIWEGAYANQKVLVKELEKILNTILYLVCL